MPRHTNSEYNRVTHREITDTTIREMLSLSTQAFCQKALPSPPRETNVDFPKNLTLTSAMENVIDPKQIGRKEIQECEPPPPHEPGPMYRNFRSLKIDSTINDLSNRNALAERMVRDLSEYLQRLASDPDEMDWEPTDITRSNRDSYTP